MSYSELDESQKEQRREACRAYRGRKRKESGDSKTEQLREANRRAYAKKTGKPIPPKKMTPEHKWWAALKKKHEGKPRLEKSIVKPIFLTHSHRERYALKVEE